MYPLSEMEDDFLVLFVDLMSADFQLIVALRSTKGYPKSNEIVYSENKPDLSREIFHRLDETKDCLTKSCTAD